MRQWLGRAAGEDTILSNTEPPAPTGLDACEPARCMLEAEGCMTSPCRLRCRDAIGGGAPGATPETNPSVRCIPGLLHGYVEDDEFRRAESWRLAAANCCGTCASDGTSKRAALDCRTLLKVLRWPVPGEHASWDELKASCDTDLRMTFIGPWGQPKNGTWDCLRTTGSCVVWTACSVFSESGTARRAATARGEGGAGRRMHGVATARLAIGK